MIRLAVPEDFTSIMSIYAYARSFMQETGNPNQWGNHFPPEELIHNRIRDKQLFVLEENGTLHGAFAFIIGEDPTYLQIDNGSWLSDAPYGTIHQLSLIHISITGTTFSVKDAIREIPPMKMNAARTATITPITHFGTENAV